MAGSMASWFRTNPEFVRHRRAELRSVRAITVAVVVWFICALLGMSCWSTEPEHLTNPQRWMLFYRWLMGLQGIALTFWTLFSCAQSVSGERDRKTWEFQRTTRLTAGEILIGKLFGEPVIMYFAVLCAAPITMLAGIAAGLSLGTVISVYFFLAVTTLFLGLGGLWLSMLLESRTRGIGLIGALFLYGCIVGLYGMLDSGLPGLAALSPLAACIDLLGASPDSELKRAQAVLFGHAIPWWLMSLLLCGTLGAWLVLMLVRNLKRDFPDIRPLSRWQAIGLAAFLNFLIYALLQPAKVADIDGRVRGWFPDANSVAGFAVAINGLILFLIGLATLIPLERLKVWQGKRATGEAKIFSEDGLSWPWLAISGVVAYALMVWGLLAWDHALPLQMGTLQAASICLWVVLVFVTRDVLFLQWCTLTRLRQPVVKGVLFLALYYAAAAILAALAGVSSDDGARWVLALLTPARALDLDTKGTLWSAETFAGIALQSGMVGVLLVAISSRLQRPLRAGAAA